MKKTTIEIKAASLYKDLLFVAKAHFGLKSSLNGDEVFNIVVVASRDDEIAKKVLTAFNAFRGTPKTEKDIENIFRLISQIYSYVRNGI